MLPFLFPYIVLQQFKVAKPVVLAAPSELNDESLGKLRYSKQVKNKRP